MIALTDTVLTRPARTYAVELLFERMPTIPRTALGEAARRRSPDLVPLNPDLRTGWLSFRRRSRLVSTQWSVEPADKPLDRVGIHASMGQSWAWPEAKELVPRCRSAVVVSDHLAADLHHRDRLELFQKLLAAVIEVTRPQAIYWVPARHLVAPDAFLGAVKRIGYWQPVRGAINVRRFHIQDYETEGGGIAGDMLVDTLGLAALGLMDLQCHFRGLDSTLMAFALQRTACDMFQTGLFSWRGEMVEGIVPVCRQDESLLDSGRPVIDLDLGEPFAAGERSVRQAA